MPGFATDAMDRAVSQTYIAGELDIRAIADKALDVLPKDFLSPLLQGCNNPMIFIQASRKREYRGFIIPFAGLTYPVFGMYDAIREH